MRIGFLGLGQMGAAIAANLLRAGHALTVWNRSPGKAAPLVQAGARQAATPGEAAAGSEVVFSMLADDTALDAVIDEVLRQLPRGALHIGLSTIAVATAERLAALHLRHTSPRRYSAARTSPPPPSSTSWPAAAPRTSPSPRPCCRPSASACSTWAKSPPLPTWSSCAATLPCWPPSRPWPRP